MLRLAFSGIFFVVVATGLFAQSPTIGLPAADAAVLEDSTRQLRLDPFLEILEDPGRALTIEDVGSPNRASSIKSAGPWREALAGRSGTFVRGGAGVPNFGYSRSNFWVRIHVRNESAFEQWVLQAAFPPLDSVNIYARGPVGNFRRTVSAGDQHPLSQAAPGVIRHVHPAFRLSIPRGTTMEYYVHFVSDGSYILPLSLYEPSVFAVDAVSHAALIWTYVGIMVAMLLYNFFLFISLRDRGYLYYTLYIAAIVLFFLTYDGEARLLFWPDSPWIANASIVLALWLALISGIKFAETFLYLREHSPGMRRMTFLLMGVGIVGLFSSFFLPFATAVRIAVGASPVFFIASIASGVAAFWKGFRPARYFLLAWSLFLAFAMLLILRAFGFLPDNFVTANAALIGSAVEAILLSLGLADRINVLTTERQTAETEAANLREELREKQKLAVIGDMAAGIVHDLKNPVAVIKGYVEMADNADVGADKRSQYLRTVDQEADRMLYMVQDLLEFSRGSIAIEKKSVEVAEYLERIRRTIQPNFDAKKIRVTVSFELTGTIELDPDRFLRAIVNIAGNAADVVPTGGLFEIKLREHRDGEERRIILELADNGPGIPEPIRANLFDSFVTHGKSHGTGLGMAITKSLVEAHGGSISFITATGLGTTFRIEVPA